MLRIVKTNKAAERLFSGIYFTLITIAGYNVLLKTDYLIPMLGGSSLITIESLYTDFPIIDNLQYSTEVKNYYLLTLGYHLTSMYKLFRSNSKARRSDFMEMFLHHLLTIALYMVSYLTNMIKIGSIIMFLHDWADVPTAFTKFGVELEGKFWSTFSWCMAFPILPLWGYSRLYVFPFIVYYQWIAPFTQIAPNYLLEGHLDQDRAHVFPMMRYMALFLSFLQILHVYWYLLFIRALYRSWTKGDVKDHQEELSVDLITDPNKLVEYHIQKAEGHFKKFD